MSAVEDLVAITERAPTSPALDQLAVALAKAQSEIKGASLDKEAAATVTRTYRYADLASVWEACREPLTKHGLSVVQQPCGDGRSVGVRTTLLHASGQYMTSTIYASPRDTGPQAIGSVLTYLRRYSLSAVVGVAPDDDDDGQAAQGGHYPAEQPRRPAPANDNAKSARPAGSPPASDVPPVASSPKKPSMKALRRYNELRDKLGVTGDEARARVSKFVARDVQSINDLSGDEFDRLIVAMEAQVNAVV